MNTYIIPLCWTCTGEMLVDAETLEDATDYATRLPYLDGEYQKGTLKFLSEQIVCYPLTDQQGKVILPGDRVSVPREAGEIEQSFPGFVIDCLTDPVTVVDFKGGKHSVPAACLYVIQSPMRQV
jgi:hypothetical protein